ncbi:MAG: hypothetical protein A2Y66_02705 [Nitrospirae bacterium RBG_13_41_22]|nr:MAG: hypothetical protein A2Y66_02705 [Nitrospirae bacterium RBG_13_41_22]
MLINVCKGLTEISYQGLNPGQGFPYLNNYATSESLRLKLIQKGPQKATEYPWEKVFKPTI